MSMVDPGFVERGGQKIGDLGAALRPPVGPEQIKPWGGPGGEAFGSFQVLGIWKRLLKLFYSYNYTLYKTNE